MNDQSLRLMLRNLNNFGGPTINYIVRFILDTASPRFPETRGPLAKYPHDAVSRTDVFSIAESIAARGIRMLSSFRIKLRSPLRGLVVGYVQVTSAINTDCVGVFPTFVDQRWINRWMEDTSDHGKTALALLGPRPSSHWCGDIIYDIDSMHITQNTLRPSMR